MSIFDNEKESYQHNWKLYTASLLIFTALLIAFAFSLGFIEIDKKAATSASAGLGGLLFIILLVAGSLIIYFLPTIAAIGNSHHNLPGIVVLNIFLGWTFIGWVVALVWSFSKGTQPVAVQNITQSNNYFCRQCNALNPITQRFCGNCGHQNLG